MVGALKGLEKMDYVVFFPPVGTLQWPDQVWWPLWSFWSLAIGWVLLRHTEKKSVPILYSRTEGRAFPSKHSILLLSLPRAAVYSRRTVLPNCSRVQGTKRTTVKRHTTALHYIRTMHWISFTCCGSYKTDLMLPSFFSVTIFIVVQAMFYEENR